MKSATAKAAVEAEIARACIGSIDADAVSALIRASVPSDATDQAAAVAAAAEKIRREKPALFAPSRGPSGIGTPNGPPPDVLGRLREAAVASNRDSDIVAYMRARSDSAA